MGCFARDSMGHHRTGFLYHNGTSRDVLRGIQQPQDTTAAFMYSCIPAKNRQTSSQKVVHIYPGSIVAGASRTSAKKKSEQNKSAQDSHLKPRTPHIKKKKKKVLATNNSRKKSGRVHPPRIERTTTSYITV